MISNSSYNSNYDLFVSMLAEIVGSYISKNPVEEKELQDKTDKSNEDLKGGE